jgi:rhodanese-related sulfurtransferase
MPTFPLPLATLLGKPGEFLVYLLIGFAFGYVLEISGFGHSPKLAAQFYFKELTVLKVMFTAIVVAMVLVFISTAVGLLDYNLVYVNPTYLWPGIVGGLIMGVGFILGGFCPGTSLVAAATAKIDGIFFVLGGLFGIYLFGETVGFYEIFWNSSYLGRFTLPEWLGLPTGVVVLLVVLMAIFMFWGAEQLERIVGGKDLSREPRLRYAGAGALVLLAGLVVLIGQPTSADRWARISAEKELLLNSRSVYVHPAEVMDNINDFQVRVVLLDVRSEADFNLFHLLDAQRVELYQLLTLSEELQLAQPNTVFILMSNDEIAATEAWKVMMAESVQNVYILEGGVNHWLAVYGGEDGRIQPVSLGSGSEQLRYNFPAALGAGYPAAFPHWKGEKIEYIPKIELKEKRGPSGGGCG